MSRMALRRAALSSLSEPRPLAPMGPLAVESVASGSLHSGQRLANPGLPGRSSNSSPQATQTLTGKAMTGLFYRVFRERCAHRGGADSRQAPVGRDRETVRQARTDSVCEMKQRV